MCKQTGTIRHLPLLSAFAAALLLGGCAGGGVEFEGAAFEAIGLATKKNSGDKKVPNRAPLLIPPDRTRLPAPTMNTATVASAPQNWPVDPDELRKEEASDSLKKRREYEEKGDWSKKADIDEFDKLMDPMSRNPGIFGDSTLPDKYRGSDDPDAPK